MDKSISFVVPTILRKSLYSTLESIRYNYKSSEIILSVDTKYVTDSNQLDELVKQFNCKIVIKGNGPAEVKNAGITEVTSSNFMVLDDDDQLSVEFSTTINKYLGYYNYIIPGIRSDADYRVVPLIPKLASENLFRYSEYDRRTIGSKLIIPSCTIIRTELWRELKLEFIGTKWDDVIPMYSLVDSCHGLWVNHPLIKVAKSENSVTSRESDLEVLSKVMEKSTSSQLFLIALTNLLES